MIKDQGLKAFVVLDALDAQRPLQAFFFFFCYLTFPLKLAPIRRYHFLMQADLFLSKGKTALPEGSKESLAAVFLFVSFSFLLNPQLIYRK